MTNKQKGLIKLAIITMSLVQLGTNGIAPILAQIQEAFPQASATSIQFLMTFPSLFSLVFSLVCAFLSDRLPKKTLAVFGLIIVGAAGVLAFLFHGSIGILFVWAAVLGTGIGLVVPVAPSLINELFEGGERQTMLGWQNAASNAGSMIMTFLGGFLAVAGWEYGYLVYLICIPGIIFTLIGVPGKKQAAADIRKEERGKFRLVIWREMIITFVLMIVFSAVPANLSMMVAERSLGNSAVAGTMSTLFLCGGLVCGILFGVLAKVLKKRTDFVGALLLGTGALLIALFSNVIVIYFACLIAGASISLIMPTCMGGAGKLKGYETLNSSLILATSFVGVFITPLMTSLAAAITGSESTTYRFYMVAIIAGILAVLTIVLKIEPKRLRA